MIRWQFYRDRRHLTARSGNGGTDYGCYSFAGDSKGFAASFINFATPLKLAAHLRQAAFSLAEVMVAVGIFGILASSSIVALNQMNNRAFLSRCQTGASTVAQNQIDLILSDMPFNPQKNQVPPELTIGTTNLGSATNATVPVYTDPRVGGIVVFGWMDTTVTDTATTVNGVALSIYRISVKVSYKFRGKTYAVTMDTMRCSDI